MNEQKMDRSDIHNYEFANLSLFGILYYSVFKNLFEKRVDRKYKIYLDFMKKINEQAESLNY